MVASGRVEKSGDAASREVLLTATNRAGRLVATLDVATTRDDPSDRGPSRRMAAFSSAPDTVRIKSAKAVSLWRLLATFARRKMLVDRASVRRSNVWRAKTRVSLKRLSLNSPNRPTRFRRRGGARSFATLKAELPKRSSFVDCRGSASGPQTKSLADHFRRSTKNPYVAACPRCESCFGPEAKPPRGGQAATSLPTCPESVHRSSCLAKLISSGGFGKVYAARLQSEWPDAFAVKLLGQSVLAKRRRRSPVNSRERSHRITNQTRWSIIRYLGYGEITHGGPYASASDQADGRCKRST